MRVAFIQINCKFGNKEHNIHRVTEMIKANPAELYVLPELFNSGYLFADREETARMAEEIPDGPTCRQLADLARHQACFLVAGLAERSGDKIFNSAILIGPKGYIATYRKIHLFDEEKTWFDAGDHPFAVHDIGIAKIGMMICFDWIFPESVRSLALQGADIICHPANLVLPYCQRAMTTRCLENGVFAITANRIGVEQRKG
ncbi:acyltransferase, partial [candidate division KSB1 bacterium]|nr:acyltransferase [candidate division KSB1 bacterium]